MSIQKKSLINTLKTTKKANIVKDEVGVAAATISPVKMHPRAVATRVASPRVALRKTNARKTLRKAQGRRPN
jgi:hypothetical protein